MPARRIRAPFVALLAAGVVLLTSSHRSGASAHATEPLAQGRRMRQAAPPASGAALVAALGCAGCHAGVGSANAARARAPTLANIGIRSSLGTVFASLATPVRVRRELGPTRMPDFRLGERERLALTLYIGTLRQTDGDTAVVPSALSPRDVARLDAAFARARAAHPEVTAVVGKRIFVALNCAACHVRSTVSPWRNGPDLSAEGSRVTPAWLRAFLRTPHAIRPFGTEPGTGGRMPDFHLTADEADSLASYLAAKRTSFPSFHPRPLSVFAQHEAESLLRHTLPCLGCHRLGNEGGRIGPDLSTVRGRLRPEYIRAMISDPRHTAPWAIMPEVPMPPRTLELVATYLSERAPTPASPRYLSLVDNPPRPPGPPSNGARTAAVLYERICANCHGAHGEGDGWNARYLPVRPTAHADPAYMSTRTDGTLYDGIAGGGLILGRSNRMPAFGRMLSRAEIRSLVAYIRTLCACQAPAWSRDGAPVGHGSAAR